MGSALVLSIDQGTYWPTGQLAVLGARPEGRREMTLGQLMDRYIDSRVSDCDPTTIKAYRRSARVLAEIGAAGPVWGQTPASCQDAYDQIRRERGPSSATHTHKVARAAWRRAAKRGEAPEICPWSTVRLAPEPKRKLYFPSGWLPSMVALLRKMVEDGNLSVRVGRFLCLCLCTGARPWKEVARLRVSDIDQRGGVLLIRDGKHGRQRSIPLAMLGAGGRATLEAQVQLVDDLLWPGRDDPSKPWTRKSVGRSWPRVLKAAAEAGMMHRTLDGQPLRLYDAGRHGMASFLLGEIGVPPVKVAAILGHSAQELIDTYAHVGVQHVMEAAEATGEAFDAACDDGGDDGGAWGVDPQRIREARETAGLYQDAIAELCGVSKAAVSKWETGKSLPSLGSVHRIAVKTGRSLDFLFHRPPKSAA